MLEPKDHSRPFTLLRIAVCVGVVALLTAGRSFAQGSIFGAVSNADLTMPASGDLVWFGLLDDTDEEIRIESNIGAGYDGANWFDDFQNYTTEAAGNPYDFFYNNLANGEASHLAGNIPDNSFQQENVQLAPTAVVPRPAGLMARIVSPDRIDVAWSFVPGLTVHVYRRETSNNGTYHRIDDPSGNLANRGIADSIFVDSLTGGVTDYMYVLIAENDAGAYSAHSVEATAGSTCGCPNQGDVAPLITQGDGTINVLDIVETVNFVFRFGPPLPSDATCPSQRADVAPALTCGDGTINVLDVVYLIDHVFRFGPAVCDPCN